MTSGGTTVGRGGEGAPRPTGQHDHHHTTTTPKGHTMFKRLTITAAAALAAATLTTLPAEAADRPTWRDCRTAEPRTSDARACEDRGWRIEREFAVTPKRIAVRVDMPRCVDLAGVPGSDTNCHTARQLRYTRWGGLRLVWYVDGIRR